MKECLLRTRKLSRVSIGTARALSLILVVVAARVEADDWPFFRGPRHNGRSTESGWTTQWPAAGPKIAW